MGAVVCVSLQHLANGLGICHETAMLQLDVRLWDIFLHSQSVIESTSWW